MRNLNFLACLFLSACLTGPDIESSSRSSDTDLCLAEDEFSEAEYLSDFGFRSGCLGTSSASFFSTQELPGYLGLKPFSFASFSPEGEHCVIDAEFGYTFEGKSGEIVLELPAVELELCTLQFSSELAKVFSVEEWKEIEIRGAHIDGRVIEKMPGIEIRHPTEGTVPNCTNASQLFEGPVRLNATLTIAIPQKLMRPLSGLGSLGTRLYWQISEVSLPQE